MWNGMGCKKGVKNTKVPKIRPAVPVQVSDVSVQVALYRFLHYLYRYRLDLYRYTCSHFSSFFLFGSIFIFCKLGTVVPM